MQVVYVCRCKYDVEELSCDNITADNIYDNDWHSVFKNYCTVLSAVRIYYRATSWKSQVSELGDIFHFKIRLGRRLRCETVFFTGLILAWS